MFYLQVCAILLFVCRTQAIQSLVTLSETGTEFAPIDENALLLGTYTYPTNKECIQACHMNCFCRIFDYDSISQRCRLFEGDLETTGSIIDSNSSTSFAGQIQLSPNLFSAYGQPCCACFYSRYLTCVNGTCDCLQHTYWTGSMCAAQNLRGGQCSSSDQCRADLNYTCLQFFQCGPASLLTGKIIFGNINGTPGNSTSSLNTPWGISINADNSILIADNANKRILHINPNSSVGTIVAGAGGDLTFPCKAIFDHTVPPNLYVLNPGGNRMMLWPNNSSINGTYLFGSTGSNFNQVRGPQGFYMDSNKSFYIADSGNHRVLLWLYNATNGNVIAGITNVIGNDTLHLNSPADVFVDEQLGQMYVADSGNNRIVKYTIGSLNGSVVAGGNGRGTQRNQLNGPNSVYVSKKTGAIYIAELNNSRIQRWNVGDTQGVTIAGSPMGIWGTSNSLFNMVNAVALDPGERYLFVVDRNNHQIKKFELV